MRKHLGRSCLGANVREKEPFRSGALSQSNVSLCGWYTGMERKRAAVHEPAIIFLPQNSQGRSKSPAEMSPENRTGNEEKSGDRKASPGTQREGVYPLGVPIIHGGNEGQGSSNPATALTARLLPSRQAAQRRDLALSGPQTEKGEGGDFLEAQVTTPPCKTPALQFSSTQKKAQVGVKVTQTPTSTALLSQAVS